MTETLVFKSTLDDCPDAWAIREQVFINEQSVPRDEERDRFDDQGEHGVLYTDGIPVATGRLILDDGVFRIGRVAVLKAWRGQHLGWRIMVALIDRAFDRGASDIHIHAQTYARVFYEKLGFTAYGDPFMDTRIPHIHMKRVRSHP